MVQITQNVCASTHQANVGIGTNSVGGTTTSRQVTISGSAASQLTLAGGGSFYTNVGTNGTLGYLEVTGAKDLALYTNGSEAMRIDSSGRVGIGTSSQTNLLHLKDEGYQLKLEDTSSGNTGEVLVSDTSLYFFSDRSNAKANSDIRFSVDNSETYCASTRQATLVLGRVRLAEAYTFMRLTLLV